MRLFSRSTRKSQIPAIDRIRLGLPMKPGRAATMTRDYERHGATTLFPVLNILDGTVIGRNMQNHRQQGFIRLLNTIEEQVPKGRGIPAGRPLTSTSASWPNVVEGLFAKLTRQRLKRGVFRSVIDLRSSSTDSSPKQTAIPNP
jgi:hypothetical protein